MPSKQAEAITAAITEVLNDSLENVSQSFVSKAEMQRVSISCLLLYNPMLVNFILYCYSLMYLTRCFSMCFVS